LYINHKKTKGKECIHATNIFIACMKRIVMHDMPGKQYGKMEI